MFIVKIVRKLIFRIRKINVSLRASIDNLSNSLNLNLEAASNTIMARARIPTDVRKIFGNDIKGEPLYSN